jgi:TfoX/Sxy family transcriptional regulator of competence genes
MTKLTDDDIRQIIASTFADDSFTYDDIVFARAIGDAVLERAASVCDNAFKERGGVAFLYAAQEIRAMKNKEE